MEYPDPFSLAGFFGACSNGPPGRVHTPPVVSPPPSVQHDPATPVGLIPPGPQVISVPIVGLIPAPDVIAIGVRPVGLPFSDQIIPQPPDEF